MLAMLAAATLAMAPAPAPAAAPAHRATPNVFVLSREPRWTGVCKGAARLQTSYEPALLYRRDPATDRVKKLIEMPMATGCLLGATPEPVRRGE